MAEQNGAGRDLPHEIQQVGAVGVRGEVVILYLAPARDLAGAGAEDECFAQLRGLHPAAGRAGVGVTDEEDGLFLIAGHALGEVVRGGVLAHHAGGDDEDASARELHALGLTFLEDDEVERLAELQVCVLAVGAVGFQIVNLREDAAETADVDGLLLQLAFAHEHREQGQDFLRAPERERGDEHAALAFEHALDVGDEALDLLFAGEAGGHGAVAARGFHDEHVSLHVVKARTAQDGLVVETDVAGVEQGFLLAAQHDARRAERVAGVKEFQRGRGEAGARLGECGPGDFAVVFEALKVRRDFIQLVVGVERVFADAQLLALAGHHVDGVVQHALRDEITQVSHQHVRLGKIFTGDGQRADVVVVAMRDGDGVHVLILDGLEQRQTIAAFEFGVHAGVEQDAVAFEVHTPRARPDVGGGIQIRNLHPGTVTGPARRGHLITEE